MSNSSVKSVVTFGTRFRLLLNKPLKVMLLCNIAAGMLLFFNGTLWRLWGLKHDLATIQQQILDSKETSRKLDLQIKQAKDPSFIERQAKDKLDMVGEKDLVFVFAD